MTQYNVTARMGRGITDDETHVVFTELAHLHPGIGYPQDDAELIFTVDEAADAAAAVAVVEPEVTGRFGAARQFIVETTADFDAAVDAL